MRPHTDHARDGHLPTWAAEFLTGVSTEASPPTAADALTWAWLHDTYVHRDRTIAGTAALATAQFGLLVNEHDIYAALDRHGITWRNGGSPTPSLTRELLVRRYVEDRWPLQRIADEVGVSREAVRKARDRFGIARRRNGLAGRVSRSRLEQLYVEEAKSVRQVAEVLSSSPASVSRLLAEHGISRRSATVAEDVVDVDTAVSRYGTGESLRSIAADVGVTDTTLRNLLLRSGVPLRGKRRLHEEISHSELAGMLDAGSDVAAIAEALGCTTKSVHRLLVRYELDRPTNRS